MLSDGSPRELLGRLLDGDPLGVIDRCDERLRSQAILLDRNALHLRAIAHVARHGPSYRGTPAFSIWLGERIRKAVTELLAEHAEMASDGALPRAPSDGHLLEIARALGIEPASLARGCVAFNRAPYEVRSAFFGIVLAGQVPAMWAEKNGTTPEKALAALRRAFMVLGVRRELNLDDLLGEVEDGG